MKFENRAIFTAIISLIIFLCCSCSQSVPECVTEYHKDMMIQWGNLDASNKYITAYKLDEFGNLYYVKNDTSKRSFVIEKIAEVDVEKFCGVFYFTNTVAMRTQALNAPGAQSRFIDFKIPATRVFSRAVWNPVFQTVGSRQHRLLYDSLMTIVPKEHFMYDSLRLSSFEKQK